MAGGGWWLLWTAVLHEACPQSVHCAVPLTSHLQQLLLLKWSDGRFKSTLTRVKGILPRVKNTLPKVKGTLPSIALKDVVHQEFKISTQGS